MQQGGKFGPAKGNIVCQDTNKLCKTEPAFLLDILCQIETVSQQCPKRCNKCSEVENTEASKTSTTPTTTVDKCVDTNNDFTDDEGNSCEFYKYDDECGDYDDDDFQAEKMCCFCGGGYDPLDKSAEDKEYEKKVELDMKSIDGEKLLVGSAVQNPLNVLLGSKSIPNLVNGKVIAGDTTSARLTLLKKLPVLDRKQSLNHPAYPDLTDYIEGLSEYDWMDNQQNQNYEPIDY